MPLDAFFSSTNKKHYLERDAEQVHELYEKVLHMNQDEQAAWVNQFRDRKPTTVESIVRRRIGFVLRQRRIARLRARAAKAVTAGSFNPIVNTSSFNTASGALS
jgi:hypothetical protein